MEDYRDNLPQHLRQQRRLANLPSLTEDEKDAMWWAWTEISAQELAAELALAPDDSAARALEREARRGRQAAKSAEKALQGSMCTIKDGPSPVRKYERVPLIVTPNLPLSPTGRLIPGKTIPFASRVILEGPSRPAAPNMWVGTAREKREQAEEYAALDHSEDVDNLLHDIELEAARQAQAKRPAAYPPARPADSRRTGDPTGDPTELVEGCTVLASDRGNYGTLIRFTETGARVRFVNNEEGTVATPELPLWMLTRVR